FRPGKNRRESTRSSAALELDIARIVVGTSVEAAVDIEAREILEGQPGGNRAVRRIRLADRGIGWRIGLRNVLPIKQMRALYSDVVHFQGCVLGELPLHRKRPLLH